METFASLQRFRASHANNGFGSSGQTDWATFTPTVTGGGTATFSSATGRWRRVGPSSAPMIEFDLTLVVNAAGSGAVAVSVVLAGMGDIARTSRINFSASIENAGLSGFHAVTLTSGSGKTIDRLRSGTATNLTGADLTAGRIISLGGRFEEV